MKKKQKKAIVFIVLVLVTLFGGILYLNREYPDDENTLYSVKFNKVKLRFERYDYALGQNQIVGVEKSTNRGKTYEKFTNSTIIVSMKPKFIFLNENLGFAIAKSNLTRSNDYLGFHVTLDGGKTFNNSKINYVNQKIDILTIKDVPYYDNDLLKLPCSIYNLKEDESGYEEKNLIFTSIDEGLTWNL